jgi:hypothetical protein
MVALRERNHWRDESQARGKRRIGFYPPITERVTTFIKFSSLLPSDFLKSKYQLSMTIQGCSEREVILLPLKARHFKK